MTNDELKQLIRECAQECISELDENKWKHLAAAGLVGLAALVNQKIKPASYQAHPSISQTSTNQDVWKDIERDAAHREKISKELGDFPKKALDKFSK